MKHRMQSFINLLGLTVGFISCLGILVYVLAQTGYDKGFSDSEDIYRLRTRIRHLDNSTPDSDLPSASPPIAFAMKDDYPEVKEVCRIAYIRELDTPIRPEMSMESQYAKGGYLADSTFFKIFDYPVLEGDVRHALDASDNIAISDGLARQLFGSGSALNQVVVLGAGKEASRKTVTAVFKKDFSRTHLNPNYILPMNTPGLGEFVMNNQNFATQNFIYSYIKLKPGTKAAELERKLPDFLQRHGAGDLAQAGFEKTLLMQPISDIHLYSEGIGPQLDRVSDIKFLIILLVLASAILLVASVNYINLKTAFANKRAKEIGMRKVVGAGKRSLAFQFLGESLLITSIAALISIPLTYLTLPFINTLGQSQLGIKDLLNPSVLLVVCGVTLITGLFAGIYPALVLAAVRPINALKSSQGNITPGSSHFRKGLVVFQFVVSASLVISVLVIMQQLRFGQNMDLGFRQANLLAIHLGTQETSAKFKAISEEFAEVPGVKEVAGTNNYPSQTVFGDFGGHLPEVDPARATTIHYSGISPGYIRTAGMKLLAGRDFRENDSTQTIVNQATLDALEIPLDEALTTTIVNTYEGKSESFRIIGVVENYHYAPLTEKIAPIALFNESRPAWLVLRTATSDYKGLLATLESHWKTFTTETPFDYTFVDRKVQDLFEEEQRLGAFSMVFTGLAILISCLGLIGLISYMAEQKKKEIGIRKVLGASVNSVVLLLTREFLNLIVIALLLAFPLGYFVMNRWLQGFSYQVNISWWVFGLAGILLVIISLATTSFQAIRAALANPVKSLRTE